MAQQFLLHQGRPYLLVWDIQLIHALVKKTAPVQQVYAKIEKSRGFGRKHDRLNLLGWQSVVAFRNLHPLLKIPCTINLHSNPKSWYLQADKNEPPIIKKWELHVGWIRLFPYQAAQVYVLVHEWLQLKWNWRSGVHAQILGLESDDSHRKVGPTL